MSAYVIFTRKRTLEPKEMELRIKSAAAGFAGDIVKVLPSHTYFEVIEGPADGNMVLLEFPSMDQAKDWDRSPAYDDALQHRLRGGEYRCVMVEGN